MFDWDRFIRPYAWQQNFPTSLEWDAKLNELLDNNEVEIVDKFTCMVGDCEVWVENWPYGFGTSWTLNQPKASKVLPTMKTRLRLRRRLQKCHQD